MYTAETLGKILRDKYLNAKNKDKVVTIHLFGIEYWKIIVENNISVQEIISNAEMQVSYATELSKGIRIGRHENLNVDNNINEIEYAWYVGAAIDDNDLTEEFIEKGIWLNGNREKYSGIVNQVKPNDRIAIKSTYTVKNGLPFKTNGEYVSAIRIKAIGIVKENLNDGKNLIVDWDRQFKTKDWYVLTLGIRKTISKLTSSDINRQAFLDFTFKGKEQNYSEIEKLERLSEIEDLEIAEKLSQYSNYDYFDSCFVPTQKILFGAPGTGKSYMIDEIIKDTNLIDEDIQYYTSRIIFHSNYSYYDFVGSIRPLRSKDRLLEYVFVPGPFTLLLKKCFQNPKQKFFLIIEELNRGNVSEILGDVIQLLDREKDGKSKYKILNPEIANYLRNEVEIYDIFDSDYIWLPSNFNIICTMNTADQNVYSIDSAIRRRFSMEFVKIDFKKIPLNFKAENKTFAGSVALMELYSNTNLYKQVEILNDLNCLNRNWPTFALLVNKIIDKINEDGGVDQISEDKKLGPFFVTIDDLENRKAFMNKVIYYLKHDVFKYEERFFADSFQEIYNKYINDDQDIFELLKDRIK